jgi:hypothetical protein
MVNFSSARRFRLPAYADREEVGFLTPERLIMGSAARSRAISSSLDCRFFGMPSLSQMMWPSASVGRRSILRKPSPSPSCVTLANFSAPCGGPAPLSSDVVELEALGTLDMAALAVMRQSPHSSRRRAPERDPIARANSRRAGRCLVGGKISILRRTRSTARRFFFQKEKIGGLGARAARIGLDARGCVLLVNFDVLPNHLLCLRRRPQIPLFAPRSAG